MLILPRPLLRGGGVICDANSPPSSQEGTGEVATQKSFYMEAATYLRHFIFFVYSVGIVVFFT